MCFVHQNGRRWQWEHAGDEAARTAGAPSPRDASPRDAEPRDAEPRDAAPARPAPAAPGGRDPDVRVSSAEREEVASLLARHYADGRLTLGEYEERVATALEARTGRDLDALLTDLPAPARVGRAPSGPPVRDRRPPRERPRRDRPGAPSARAVAVVAVVVLAFAAGPWALWLLWPALALTGGGSCHRGGAHHAGAAHPDRRVPTDA